MLEDLTGRQFGFLTVKERAPSGPKQPRLWRCECACGGEIISSTYRLTKGLTTHCGCKKIKDLTGQTFGKLYVIGLSDKRGKRGSRTTILWECRCECGEICYKPTDILKNEDESMCAKCADISHTTKARAKAGFVDGTQVSRLKSEKPNVTNTSGVKGVSYHSRDGRWSANIGFKGQKITLGYYHNFADAVKARQRAEEEYFGTFLEEYDRQQLENTPSDEPDRKDTP